MPAPAQQMPTMWPLLDRVAETKVGVERTVQYSVRQVKRAPAAVRTVLLATDPPPDATLTLSLTLLVLLCRCGVR